MAEQKQRCLQAREYLGEISALCFLHVPRHPTYISYLLAGTGSQIILYDLEMGVIIRTFQVFEGIRVHGVASCLSNNADGSISSMFAFRIAVFGETRVKLFNLNFEMTFLTQNQQKVCADLVPLHVLPRFSQWVLDASFLKGDMILSHKGSNLLAVGCSDNSVRFWDIQRASVILESWCSEKCLLYSMRLWGDELGALRIASGTIYNEIIVWMIVHQNDHMFGTVLIHTLVGHEGSIFRITWSTDGSTLVSASDDRSARIWKVCLTDRSSNDPVVGSRFECVGNVLFGHNARVWDCCFFDSLIITVGEDCTCRVWGLKGEQVKMIKEHTGRGIWRCLYDPLSSLLVTAGFDSAIKVHQLSTPSRNLGQHVDEVKEFADGMEIFTAHIPNSSAHERLMDSKSEYVRCLHFANEDVLYVATNHGYLYHVNVSNSGSVKWIELVQVGKDTPAICMDLLCTKVPYISHQMEDWISVGDGQGRVTILCVCGISILNMSHQLSWSAELKRGLLGTFWCKSLGNRYIFTVDPKGMLKLWKLSQNFVQQDYAFLIAEFQSCFGIRIMCLNVSFDEEILVCGDLRGNIILFPLTKHTLGAPDSSKLRIPVLNYFKGGHGISCVCSISIKGFNSDQIEIFSTGGDGCICNMEYDKDKKCLNFIGLTQVKELNLIESISTNSNSVNDLANKNYAIGFSSADFIIWNLETDLKVVKVSCGGWRRPHAYHVGNMAEMKNCFAYVKEEVIYIHKHWVYDSVGKMFPHNLHMQFHGREIHSLSFVASDSKSGSDIFGKSRSMFLSTGCEDGTVRLTGYTSDVDKWSASKLLGEHVGGSAVRSVCCASETHIVHSNVHYGPNNRSYKHIDVSEESQRSFLLISVGAKRVLTCWLLKEKKVDGKEAFLDCSNNGTCDFSSMTFRWLSTDMPIKNFISKTRVTGKNVDSSEKEFHMEANASSISPNPENKDIGLKSFKKNVYGNDWRYLAVTAFLVKSVSASFFACFVVVACSDATLALRALLLPCRLWFDVAILVPLSSPVLALQHVIIPMRLVSGDSMSAFIVISGSTDGSIQFWDLSVAVRTFMQKASTFPPVDDSCDFVKRPPTGRGSQGGRLWRFAKNFNKNTESGEMSSENCAVSESPNTSLPETGLNKTDFMLEMCEIKPIIVLSNVHQSGVNCLHVSVVKLDQGLVGSNSRYVLLSGGDDQSLCCIGFELESVDFDIKSPDDVNPIAESGCKISFLYRNSVPAAHSSAVKGIWTDGKWVFSTGLDQRVRCWENEKDGTLSERDHIIVSVPEPETLDARQCGPNNYVIGVGGRGLQIVEFSPKP